MFKLRVICVSSVLVHLQCMRPTLACHASSHFQIPMIMHLPLSSIRLMTLPAPLIICPILSLSLFVIHTATDDSSLALSYTRSTDSNVSTHIDRSIIYMRADRAYSIYITTISKYLTIIN